MSGVDFDSISKAALPHLESLCCEWLPGGKRDGSEYVALNPTRGDRKAGSFRINIITGKWCDFASSDSGSDPISLVAYLEGVKQGEAAKRLSKRLGMPIEQRKAPMMEGGKPGTSPAADWIAQPHAPQGHTFPTFRHPAHGTPSAQWCYKTADGLTIGYVCRYDLADGGKDVIPFSWCRHKDTGETKWRMRGFPTPRPLYGLDRLADRPDASVIVVEGEKSADAAARIMPDFVAVSWPGGGKGVRHSDWLPLAGRRVFIWPDRDRHEYKETDAPTLADIGAVKLWEEQPGYQAALAISERVESSNILTPPDGKKDGWDAADAEVEGFDPVAHWFSVPDDEIEPPDDQEPAPASSPLEAIPDVDGSIPANVFPIPTGGISYTEAATIIFPVIGEKRRLFMRDRIPHEIATGQEADFLLPVSPERFCNLIEGFGKRIARREKGTGKMEGKTVWRKTTLPVSAAKILLQSDVAADHLPAIRQLANCPIFTAAGEIIGRGYHAHAGGTYISRGQAPPNVPLDAATTALVGLLKDFAFVTDSDRSRALASLISPALKMGGWVNDDFPLDVAEADQSQSGKTYRQKLVSRLYAETPSSITSPKGGVGSVDEAIATALIKGRPFVTLDNFRGRLDSTILEEAIRGHGRVTCRALRTSAEVDCTPFIWQLSTNGAELTRDLANRSIITRIRKQPEGYVFQSFAAGDLLDHVEANQSFYLGAIFAAIREWAQKGCPRTNESRHDFRGWCRSLDWIIQNVFGMPPLLDGHREEQARTANPALQWLREIAHAASGMGMLCRELTASELVSIAEDSGIEFPGNPANREEPSQRAGKILSRLFRETNGKPVMVDGFTISRREFTTYEDASKIHRNYAITI